MITDKNSIQLLYLQVMHFDYHPIWTNKVDSKKPQCVEHISNPTHRIRHRYLQHKYRISLSTNNKKGFPSNSRYARIQDKRLSWKNHVHASSVLIKIKENDRYPRLTVYCFFPVHNALPTRPYARKYHQSHAKLVKHRCCLSFSCSTLAAIYHITGWRSVVTIA